MVDDGKSLVKDEVGFFWVDADVAGEGAAAGVVVERDWEDLSREKRDFRRSFLERSIFESKIVTSTRCL